MVGSDTELIVDATLVGGEGWGGESPGYLHLAVRVGAAVVKPRFDEEFGDEGCVPSRSGSATPSSSSDRAGVREVPTQGRVESSPNWKNSSPQRLISPSVAHWRGLAGSRTDYRRRFQCRRCRSRRRQDGFSGAGCRCRGWNPGRRVAVEHGGQPPSSVPEGESPPATARQILGLARRVKAEGDRPRAEHREVAAPLLAESAGPIVVTGERGSGADVSSAAGCRWC